MADEFTWPMSAELHRDSVGHLRENIIRAYQTQTDFPIGEILDFLPLNTDQKVELAARGSFEFDGEMFSNVAKDALTVEFDDEVLKAFSLEIPPIWSGEVEVNGDELIIRFTKPLELEIPEIAEQGVNRSIYQKYAEISVDLARAKSKLIDGADNTKLTWILAILDRSLLGTSALIELANTATRCDGDDNEKNWYVYARNNDGLCIVNYGTFSTGGQIAYSYRFGPGTRSECNAWESRNCSPSC